MRKICAVSNLHLSANPRLWKEANTLAAAGYQVVILTIWTSAEKGRQDLKLVKHPGIQYKAAINLAKGQVNPVKRFWYRARRRVGFELKKYFKIDTSWILDYAPAKMLGAALSEDADLYICHTEYGMLTGKGLLEKKKKVAFDIEDWYSHDYLVPSRPVKLLKRLEKTALEQGVYCTCPSTAMAEALQNTYPGTPRADVIYNGFSVTENIITAGKQVVEKGEIPSFIWFSQTIGPGRGLEAFFSVLKEVNTPVQVHLLGNCEKAYEEQLKNRFPYPSGHKLFFHSPVAHDHLVQEISKYDIGLALEQNFPESRNTTITNKIIQYLQAGLKVLATATKGQQEVAALFPGTIETVPVKDIKEWAPVIDKLIHTRVDKQNQLEKFNAVFSWEAQEKKLLSLVEKALSD